MNTFLPVATTGRNSIPLALVRERRRFELDMKINGMAVETIIKQVNSKAEVYGWGTVTRRTVERDLAAYYRKNQVMSITEGDHNLQLRAVHIDQMQKTIEKLEFHVRDSKKLWKSFEYASALAELFKMQSQMMEIENWNYGRANLAINNTQTNINNVFEKGAIEIKHKMQPEHIAAFHEQFKVLDAQLPEDPEEQIKDSPFDV